MIYQIYLTGGGGVDNTLNNKVEMLWILTETLFALKLSFVIVC